MPLPIAERLDRILQNAIDGGPPDREDCIYLLDLPATSLEARLVRSVADAAARCRFNDEAVLLGWIEHGTRAPEEVVSTAKDLAQDRDLYAVCLAAEGFDAGRLADTVQAARASIPPETQLIVQVANLTQAQARDLLEGGVQGARCACASPSQEDTLRIIRDAGLDIYYFCGPVGPEQGSAELVGQIFRGVEYSCLHHGVTQRVPVRGRAAGERGQITQLRLAQVVAVVALATLGCEETEAVAVHEPNSLGLTAGANVVYGRDLAAARSMLYETGFVALRRGDGSCGALDPPYRKQ